MKFRPPLLPAVAVTAVALVAALAVHDTVRTSDQQLTGAVKVVATTGDATSVTSGGAVLGGSVSAAPGSAPTATFQFGTSTAYGSSAAATTSGKGRTTMASATLGSLASGTTYHYRLVAKTSAGTAFGADRTFTTTPQPSTTSTTTTTTSSPTTSPTATQTSTSSTTTSSTSTGSTTTPTSSTTSSTTTSAPAPVGSVCTNPYFTTSDPNGGVTDGGFYVHNNLWNAAKYPGTKGTTSVCSFHSWNHTATASNSSGTGEVKTYPNVHKDYSGRTIASFPKLTSSFAATSPNVGIYDVAYDLWLNGVPNDEVMIWTDNHGQYPAGNRFATGVTLGGHTWDVYATTGNGYIAFVPSGGARLTSGTVDIKAMLDYLVSLGRVTNGSAATVDQVCYGVEVVDTGGSPATWQFTNFSLTDS
ncbi:GH12 family glycosyl hydrolase domain-containing protein [Phycicoccus sp. 3266]|uniref:GH12 family glycosyl hydrolase domain-containing protein n=1 Tax=Phycicoccus sp. 3266 TaxID=2817751 RepID=UPI00285B3E5C|nr:hypothetical protein [Phycicoccus sp. 3266]MDR6863375.1 hypothetical protein [Phycicoccus sp. 3266]